MVRDRSNSSALVTAQSILCLPLFMDDTPDCFEKASLVVQQDCSHRSLPNSNGGDGGIPCFRVFVGGNALHLWGVKL